MYPLRSWAAILCAACLISSPAWAGKKEKNQAKKLGLAKTFVLAAGKSGKCLSKVSGDKLGQQVGGWKCRAKSSNQKFKLKWVSGPWFQVRTAKGNLCIEISGGSKKGGKPAVQWSCTGKKNQHWKISNAGKLGFQLVARHSGRCLTLDDPRKKVSKFTQRQCGRKGAQQQFKVFR